MCCPLFHSFTALLFILKLCKLLAIFSKTHFLSHKNSPQIFLFYAKIAHLFHINIYLYTKKEISIAHKATGISLYLLV